MIIMASQITYPHFFVQPFVKGNIKETSKPTLLALCDDNSSVTGEFPSQRVSSAENVSIDDVIMSKADELTQWHLGPILLTWFNINPGMDK